MLHEFTLRVYYCDTDQMGIVYYANYIKWFEMARTELLRDAGWSYFNCEEDGYLLPVVSADCKYHKSAKYDDLIKICTQVDVHSRTKIKFSHTVYNQNDEKLATGNVVLGCLSLQGKILAVPDKLRDLCRIYI